jgi:hypothetical protein
MENEANKENGRNTFHTMRSHALLRLVGGKMWKAVRAASSWCFEKLIFDH